MRRWMGLEIRRMNDTLVATPRTLEELLAEERPHVLTKGGDEHDFDRAVLHDLGRRLPVPLHRRLKLPIRFFYSADVPDSCMLADPAALEALKALGELAQMREMEDGRVWVARVIVFALMARYRTMVEMAVR
jgi:uncharacterized protein (UPF0216 family)